MLLELLELQGVCLGICGAVFDEPGPNHLWRCEIQLSYIPCYAGCGVIYCFLLGGYKLMPTD